MDNQYLFDAADSYVKEKNQGPFDWNFFTFWYDGFIPERRLKEAIEAFAKYSQDEIPIILMSDGIYLKKIKWGILITDKFLYYYLMKAYKKPAVKNKIALEDIFGVDIVCNLFGAWLIINGQKEALLSRYGKLGAPEEVKVFTELLHAIFSRN